VDDFKTLGYSSQATIPVIVSGELMVISILAFEYVPYKHGMFLAGSSRMAISAACELIERGEEGRSISERSYSEVWLVLVLMELDTGLSPREK
jgi:hypothetical protein